MRRPTLWMLVLAGVFLAGTPLRAQEVERGEVLESPPKISTTEAQLLATIPGDGQDPYWVVTLQHFSTWKYGSNFFFLDLADEPGLDFYEDQPGLYLEYAPVFSLGALGLPASGGPLRDVGLTGQVNAGWTSGGFPIGRVFLEGAELAWSVPGFVVFNTQLLARQEKGWDLTWVYTFPLAVGPVNGEVTGFMDVWRRTQEGVESSAVFLAQPQILLEVATSAGSRLQVGVELEPSHDFPSRALSEGWSLAVSPMVRWTF